MLSAYSAYWRRYFPNSGAFFDLPVPGTRFTPTENMSLPHIHSISRPPRSNDTCQKLFIASQQFTLHCKISLDKPAKFRLNQGEKR
tara:strand:- start:287 stop:544 length:258 start_codon:yes stop_codon:yes gene_type:complete